MVKVNPWQLEHEYRGYSERINLAFVWTAPDLQQRTIVCFFERTASRSGEPNWRRLLQNCKARAVFPWEQMIDKRQAIYVGVDSSYEGIARRAASRAHLTLSSGVAFPPEELAGVVHQTLQHASLYRFYQVCIKAIPDQSSGIYVVCEDEHPIYVGQTHSLLQRMTGHRHSQRKPDEIAGFMDYARYRHEQSTVSSIADSAFRLTRNRRITGPCDRTSVPSLLVGSPENTSFLSNRQTFKNAVNFN